MWQKSGSIGHSVSNWTQRHVFIYVYYYVYYHVVSPCVLDGIVTNWLFRMQIDFLSSSFIQQIYISVPNASNVCTVFRWRVHATGSWYRTSKTCLISFIWIVRHILLGRKTFNFSKKLKSYTKINNNVMKICHDLCFN